jgi:hypothetical protein
MIPAVRSWTLDEMMKRVAFFKDLKGSKTGLRDAPKGSESKTHRDWSGKRLDHATDGWSEAR